jgi:hypothetical protein
LYVASSNHPAIVTHAFDRIVETAETRNLIFRYGHPDDQQSFREEITLSFYQDQSIGHLYTWGMPRGEFMPRSGLKMMRS